MDRIKLILAIALLLHCTVDNRVVGGSSETETGTVAGLVVYRDSAHVTGAIVGMKSVSPTDSPSISTVLSSSLQATTDSNGAFIFPPVARGEYVVAARFSDSLTGLVRINVKAGDTTRTIIQLTQLTPANQNPPSPEMVWSVATNEILFVANTLTGLATLVAVNAASKKMRCIDSTAGRTYGSITLSNDGRTLYYCATLPGQPNFWCRYRVAVDGTAAPEPIVPDSSIFGGFVFFAEGSLLAYRTGGLLTPNSVVVVDATTGAPKCSVALAASPYGFSTDGKNLICIAGSCQPQGCPLSDSIYIVNIASASSSTVGLPVTQSSDLGHPWFLHMDRDTLFEGYVSSHVGISTSAYDIYYVNTVSGSTAHLWGSPDFINQLFLFRTPDGRKISFWTAPSWVSSPWTLHLLSINPAVEQTVFTANTYGSSVAFSPDGNDIACMLGNVGSSSVCTINFAWNRF
jgi:hypothetical protein